MYRGEFDELMNGYGHMRYANNDEYDGEWRNGKRNGVGNFKEAATGKIQRRIYKEDELLKNIENIH
jgi:hypothetical protein